MYYGHAGTDIQVLGIALLIHIVIKLQMKEVPITEQKCELSKRL